MPLKRLLKFACRYCRGDINLYLGTVSPGGSWYVNEQRRWFCEVVVSPLAGALYIYKDGQ
ncbi:MAG: hypothetical protein HQ557_13460 [Bacteroidetes bacterium]|nr:hypothetical protein [Bacteroidota bacterium]